MKLIMENWRLFRDVLRGLQGPIVMNITKIYFKSKEIAKQKYFIPDTEINKIKDPKEKREAQDSKGYKKEAFQHILATFAIKHRYPLLSVKMMGEVLEYLQEKVKKSYDQDDKARDLKNNDIGISLAEKYKDRKITNFQDFVDTVEFIIKDGDFYTTSTTASGKLRTYKELLIARNAPDPDVQKDIEPITPFEE